MELNETERQISDLATMANSIRDRMEGIEDETERSRLRDEWGTILNEINRLRIFAFDDDGEG